MSEVHPEPEAPPRVDALTVRDAAIVACITSAIVHGALVPQHIADDPIVGGLFCAATVALVAAAIALARPALGFAPVATALLFAALLVAYPVTLLVQREGIDVLGVTTKAVEALGVVAAIKSRTRLESFASADALVGVVVGLLLLSLGAGHHQH